MKRNHTKVIVVALVVVVALGAFALYKKFQVLTPAEQQQMLTDAQMLITSNHDCTAALPKLQTLVQENPSLADAWHLKGACEFELKQLAAAKQSFQNALTLDPQHPGTATYLALLNNPTSDITTVTVNLSRQEFEQMLGWQLSNDFEFDGATSVPQTSASTTVVVARYRAPVDYAETQKSMQDALLHTGVSFTAKSDDQKTAYSGASKDGKINYAISIFKGARPIVAVGFTSLK